MNADKSRQDVCAPGFPKNEGTDDWRVFAAIEIPANIRKGLVRHIARLRDELPEVRATWTREENLHLTLKFLGETPVARVEAFSRALSQATESAHSFDLIMDECGSFSRHGAPQVLWIATRDPTGTLAQLYEAVENECAREGFAREERRFNPHLTIARLRKPEGARRLAALHQEIGFERVEFRVTELKLIRSQLSPEGSRYTTISQHALAQA